MLLLLNEFILQSKEENPLDIGSQLRLISKSMNHANYQQPLPEWPNFWCSSGNGPNCPNRRLVVNYFGKYPERKDTPLACPSVNKVYGPINEAGILRLLGTMDQLMRLVF